MADIVKNKDVIQMVADFVDGDTRTISQDDPSGSIDLAAQVKRISKYIRDNEVLIGDKAGAAFSKISSAKVVRSTTTYFDLA